MSLDYYGKYDKQELLEPCINSMQGDCGCPFPITLGWLGQTPKLLVFWIGLILQWEVKGVVGGVTDGVMVVP